MISTRKPQNPPTEWVARSYSVTTAPALPFGFHQRTWGCFYPSPRFLVRPCKNPPSRCEIFIVALPFSRFHDLPYLLSITRKPSSTRLIHLTRAQCATRRFNRYRELRWKSCGRRSPARASQRARFVYRPRCIRLITLRRPGPAVLAPQCCSTRGWSKFHTSVLIAPFRVNANVCPPP